VRMRSVDDVLTGAAQTTEDGAVGVVPVSHTDHNASK